MTDNDTVGLLLDMLAPTFDRLRAVIEVAEEASRERDWIVCMTAIADASVALDFLGNGFFPKLFAAADTLDGVARSFPSPEDAMERVGVALRSKGVSAHYPWMHPDPTELVEAGVCPRSHRHVTEEDAVVKSNGDGLPHVFCRRCGNVVVCPTAANEPMVFPEHRLYLDEPER